MFSSFDQFDVFTDFQNSSADSFFVKLEFHKIFYFWAGENNRY